MRIPKIRKPQIMDVVRIEGRFRVVRAITWPSGHIDTQSLGEVLAHNLMVREDGEWMSVRDALLADGWISPNLERPSQ